MTLLRKDFLSIFLLTAIGQTIIKSLLNSKPTDYDPNYKIVEAILFGAAILVFAIVAFIGLKQMEKLEGLYDKLVAFLFILDPITEFIQTAYETIYGPIN